MTNLRSRELGHVLCFLSLVVCALACGCVSPGQIRPVAQAGIEASALSQLAIASVRADLASFREAELLAQALGTSDGGKSTAEKVEKIRELLLARQLMFAELEKLYRAVNNLALYDAGGEVEGVVGGATSSILSYANEVHGASIPASASIEAILDRIGVSIVKSIQRRKLSKVNRGLAELTGQVVLLLEKEQASREAIAEISKTSKENLLIGLIQKRLAWPHALLAEHAAEVGLTYDPKQFIRVYEEMAKNSPAEFKAMQTGMIRAQLANLERRLNVEKDVMSSTIKAIRSLSKAHKQLEADSRRLDIQELSEIVGELRIIAGHAAAIVAEVRATRAAARAEAQAAREESQQELTQAVIKMIAEQLGITLPIP